jgi:hypothetical protein
MDQWATPIPHYRPSPLTPDDIAANNFPGADRVFQRRLALGRHIARVLQSVVAERDFDIAADGRIKIAVRGVDIDFRVSTIPTMFGGAPRAPSGDAGRPTGIPRSVTLSISCVPHRWTASRRTASTRPRAKVLAQCLRGFSTTVRQVRVDLLSLSNYVVFFIFLPRKTA